jgi:hypothetical protein
MRTIKFHTYVKSDDDEEILRDGMRIIDPSRVTSIRIWIVDARCLVIVI